MPRFVVAMLLQVLAVTAPAASTLALALVVAPSRAAAQSEERKVEGAAPAPGASSAKPASASRPKVRPAGAGTAGEKPAATAPADSSATDKLSDVALSTTAKDEKSTAASKGNGKGKGKAPALTSGSKAADSEKSTSTSARKADKPAASSRVRAPSAEDIQNARDISPAPMPEPGAPGGLPLTPRQTPRSSSPDGVPASPEPVPSSGGSQPIVETTPEPIAPGPEGSPHSSAGSAERNDKAGKPEKSTLGKSTPKPSAGTASASPASPSTSAAKKRDSAKESSASTQERTAAAAEVPHDNIPVAPPVADTTTSPGGAEAPGSSAEAGESGEKSEQGTASRSGVGRTATSTNSKGTARTIPVPAGKGSTPAKKGNAPSLSVAESVENPQLGRLHQRLACITVYWPGDPSGGYYTSKNLASTGVTLKRGHISIDPKIIRYGTRVRLEGMGEFIAVDTGGDVVNRRAARRAGKTAEEKAAIVVDIYFPTKAEGLAFKARHKRFIMATWYENDRVVLSRRK
ncbi:hypothetical protein DB346_15725 [Verrucomicrobia bacterium LW23]|nr:hypothetical protein DB346_15725 [Verrucomicrobia bacterium LW23]